MDALNKFLWYYDNRELVSKTLRLHGSADDRRHFVGSKYRDEIIAMDERHEGYPDSTHSYGLKHDRIDFLSEKHKSSDAVSYTHLTLPTKA